MGIHHLNIRWILSCTMKRITIYEGQRDRNKCDNLEAALRENGDLVLESYFLGDPDQTFWAGGDREFWIIVKAEHVPKVRKLLINERFETAAAFEGWVQELTAKTGNLEGTQDPIILLWLIKEWFADEHLFSQWLKKKKIPFDIQHVG